MEIPTVTILQTDNRINDKMVEFNSCGVIQSQNKDIAIPTHNNRSNRFTGSIKSNKSLKVINEESKNAILKNTEDKNNNSTRENLSKEREENKNYNRFQMSLLKNSVMEGYNMNDPKNYEEIIKSIKIEDLKKIAKTLLKDSKSYEIVFKPKK